MDMVGVFKAEMSMAGAAMVSSGDTLTAGAKVARIEEWDEMADIISTLIYRIRNKTVEVLTGTGNKDRNITMEN